MIYNDYNDDRREPIFSLLLKKGNRTNLEVDKEKSMINESTKIRISNEI